MLSIARKGLDHIAMAANVCGTLVVLALVLIVNTDVISRGVFSAPFRGSVEVVQFSMVLIVFLQLPDVVRVNRLTRSDGLLTMMASRRPATAAWLSKMINAVSAVLMALIAYAIWPEFVDAWETGDYFGTPGIFTAPWWPVKLVIFFSATLCCLIWVGKVIANDSSAANIDESRSDV
ncbi:MAG: TRAP transporter small permease subunit [Geminicoccales bacterium]